MPFEKELAEFEVRRARAMAMGGEKKLAERKAQGVLNARERITHLSDVGSFLESGLFAASLRPEARDKSPADGKIAGYARIDGREVAIVSNDFTVMGASSSEVNISKVGRCRAGSLLRLLVLVCRIGRLRGHAQGCNHGRVQRQADLDGDIRRGES